MEKRILVAVGNGAAPAANPSNRVLTIQLAMLRTKARWSEMEDELKALRKDKLFQQFQFVKREIRTYRREYFRLREALHQLALFGSEEV